jgi:hypothetical protein
MPIILKNNASSTLATAISASDTGIVVADGSKFPSLGAGYYFYATLVSSGGTTEVVKVTARVGNSLTVVRAQDGSSAASFASGALLEMRVNAASVQDAIDGVTTTPANDQFTGNGSTTNFTLSVTPVSIALIDVYIDGVYQNKNTFSFAGAVLTFSEAPPLGAKIEVLTNTGFGIAGIFSASAVNYNQGGTGAVTRTVQSRLRDYVSVKDFGAVGDGVTDDTAALTNAIAATATSEYGLSFEAGKNYLVSAPLSFSNSGNTVPRWVDFNGCAITASGSFSGSSVVYVENPQGKVDTFWMSNAYIDATGVNYGFYLKGGQDGRYSSLQVVNAVSHGFLIQGETGFGIYYNVFDTCKAGASTKGNGGDGFRISGVGSRLANSNTFVNCVSQFNASGGFRIGISSGNTFICCAAEENVADAGFVFGDLVTSVSIVGGFTENNIYSAADTSFRILSGAAVDNIRISGGRHNGTTNGDFTQDGIMYNTTNVGDVTIWNTDLKIRNLTLGGTGANIVSADATSIRFGDTLNPDANLTYNLGSNALRWTTVFCNDIDQNSTTGGAGSAGAGNQYITLRIDGVNYKLLHDGTV